VNYLNILREFFILLSSKYYPLKFKWNPRGLVRNQEELPEFLSDEIAKKIFKKYD